MTNEPGADADLSFRTMRLVRRAWSVAWAPLGVLALHAGLSAAFGHQRSLDPGFHFLGGVAGAAMLWRAVDSFPAVVRRGLRLDRRIGVIASMAAVVLCWELMELASDRLLGTRIQQGPLDTWSDVALGLLGAAVAVLVGSWTGAPRAIPGIRRD